MSRNLGTIESPTTREALKRMSSRIDSLTARVNSFEALNNTLINYKDTDRPSAASVPKYTMIFNTDDSFPNVSDGTQWLDPTGSAT